MKECKKITQYEIDKIFGNRAEKIEYLETLYKIKGIEEEIPRTIKKIDEEIVETWDYETSKNIIREMFRNTSKYENSKKSNKYLEKAMQEWEELKLGEYNWPFQPINFDQYIQRINCRDITEEEKDRIVERDVVKFRRIKRINTFRNDFIEYLIFENSDNVIPTLKHNRGVDFYINGYPYDQKVSKSVTNQFKEMYGERWREEAIAHPEKVAEFLYKYQDEQRFGTEPRLLIVYIDQDVTSENIVEGVKRVDFDKPIKIKFKYTHSAADIKEYSAECYIVLLYNK